MGLGFRGLGFRVEAGRHLSGPLTGPCDRDSLAERESQNKRKRTKQTPGRI